MNKLKPALFNIIRAYSTSVFNFLIALFGIKVYGKENWGEVVAVLLWVFFVIFFSNWGNQEYLLRKYSRNPSKIFELFSKNLFSRSFLLIFSFLIFLFFPFKIAFLACTLIFLIFFYNSLNSLVIYHQKFGEQLFAESLGLIVLLLTIFFFPFNITSILVGYCLAFFLKLTFLSISVQLWREKIVFEFSLKEFTNANSFFLIGLIGWLVSKTDLYIVSYFLPKTTLSSYQIFITAFLMLQALSGLMLLPYNKHLYRFNKKTINKIQQKITLISIPIVAIGTLFIWLVLEFIVKINFPLYYYFLGVLIVLPHYFSALDYVKLKKIYKEKKIITFNIVGFLIVVILSFFLVTPLGLKGILFSLCLSQWFILVLLKYTNK
ncbi:polysaccharide biosynthesis protein [Tenacibaculum ovolyticum]|uniref:hypothetical protein n=1 Tax=Tenacibaculum ovolyticum TaxID=104270 RepID=UPI001F249465|nr:hypothetical protein [Tenacibaculum ovolyticum]